MKANRYCKADYNGSKRFYNDRRGKQFIKAAKSYATGKQYKRRMRLQNDVTEQPVTEADEYDEPTRKGEL